MRRRDRKLRAIAQEQRSRCRDGPVGRLAIIRLSKIVLVEDGDRLRGASRPRLRGKEKGSAGECGDESGHQRRAGTKMREVRDLQRRNQQLEGQPQDRKSTRLNSSHVKISYAVFCLK